jgi:hypothetical protein
MSASEPLIMWSIIAYDVTAVDINMSSGPKAGLKTSH